MDDYFGLGFAIGIIATSIVVALATWGITGNNEMHYKMVDEYCGDGSAVTYDVVGSDVGKRLMLTCELPKVAL